MIIYRPHRGKLIDSIAEAKEFNNEDEMKKYIVEEWDNYFSMEDIVIYDEIRKDDRIGWNDVRNVCTKRFGIQDNISEYGYPQCIGMCATDYKMER